MRTYSVLEAQQAQFFGVEGRLAPTCNGYKGRVLASVDRWGDYPTWLAAVGTTAAVIVENEMGRLTTSQAFGNPIGIGAAREETNAPRLHRQPALPSSRLPTRITSPLAA